MATDMPEAPKGFNDAAKPTTNGDEAIELSPGEVLLGTVLDIAEGEGDYGPWYRLTIKDEDRGVVDYFAKDRVKIACKQDNIERGDSVWIAQGTEEVDLEDGGSYYPTLCKVRGDS